MYTPRHLWGQRLEDRRCLSADVAGFTTDLISNSELFGRSSSVQTSTRVDLNGDGRLDLIAVTSDGRIEAFFRQDNDTFERAWSDAVSGLGQEILAAHINNDDIIDFFLHVEGRVTPFLNLGHDGDEWRGFSPHESIPAGGMIALDAADVQGDGHLDLITATSGYVWVRSGSGDGNFRDAIRYRTPQIVDVAVGDINGDGFADLAVAKRNQDFEIPDGVVTMLNDGTGVFEDASEPFDYSGQFGWNGNEHIFSVHLNDLDGDKFSDLLVVYQMRITFSVVGVGVVGYGSPDGSMERGPELGCGTPVGEVNVRDVDADEDTDVIFRCRDTTNAHTDEPTAAREIIHLGDGDREFESRVYDDVEKLRLANPADGVWRVTPNGIEVLQPLGEDDFQMRESFELDTPAELFDANGDSVVDVASPTGGKYLAGAPGGGLLQAANIVPPAPAGHRVYKYADFNNDGLADALTHPVEASDGLSPRTMKVHLRMPDGRWRETWQQPVGETANFHIEDFTGDGWLDFVVVSHGWPNSVEPFEIPTRRLFVGIGNGEFEMTYSAFSFFNVSTTGDFDNSGTVDFAFDRVGKLAEIIFVDDSGSVTQRVLQKFVGAMGSLRNADGSSQLLITRSDGGDVPHSSLYAYQSGESRDLGIQTRPGIITEIMTGDFNGDGWQDLVLMYPLHGYYRAAENSLLDVYWGSESGEFDGPQVLATHLPATTYLDNGYTWAVSDVTGDGIDDLLVMNDSSLAPRLPQSVRVFSLESATPKNFVPLPGDANIDYRVDFQDFLSLAANFGKPDAVWSDGDFDADGTVSFKDFVILASSFGSRREAIAN